MTVKELIKELKKENGNLDVQLFCHDHDPAKHDEGCGYVFCVNECTDDRGKTFIAIST